MDHDDILGDAPEDFSSSGNQLVSFKDEMREMPLLQRMTIYASMACMVMLFIQCLFIMPVILLKYGWGYDGGFVK